MRVLIAAGGTGGHIYPGIAIAQEIMRRDPSSAIRFEMSSEAGWPSLESNFLGPDFFMFKS